MTEQRDYVAIATAFAKEAARDRAGRKHCKWVRLAAKRSAGRVRAVPDGTLAAPQQGRTEADSDAIRAAPVRRLLCEMMTKHHGGAFDADTWLERRFGESAAALDSTAITLEISKKAVMIIINSKKIEKYSGS